jgi:hypothetical protein
MKMRTEGKKKCSTLPKIRDANQNRENATVYTEYLRQDLNKLIDD